MSCCFVRYLMRQLFPNYIIYIILVIVFYNGYTKYVYSTENNEKER